jgi:hypothetical protein
VEKDVESSFTTCLYPWNDSVTTCGGGRCAPCRAKVFNARHVVAYDDVKRNNRGFRKWWMTLSTSWDSMVTQEPDF